jgi:hypothetical protein
MFLVQPAFGLFCWGTPIGLRGGGLWLAFEVVGNDGNVNHLYFSTSDRSASTDDEVIRSTAAEMAPPSSLRGR